VIYESKEEEEISEVQAQNLQMMSFLVDHFVKTPFFSRKDFQKENLSFPSYSLQKNY